MASILGCWGVFYANPLAGNSWLVTLLHSCDVFLVLYRCTRQGFQGIIHIMAQVFIIELTISGFILFWAMGGTPSQVLANNGSTPAYEPDFVGGPDPSFYETPSWLFPVGSWDKETQVEAVRNPCDDTTAYPT